MLELKRRNFMFDYAFMILFGFLIGVLFRIIRDNIAK